MRWILLLTAFVYLNSTMPAGNADNSRDIIFDFITQNHISGITLIYAEEKITRGRSLRIGETGVLTNNFLKSFKLVIAIFRVSFKDKLISLCFCLSHTHCILF